MISKIICVVFSTIPQQGKRVLNWIPNTGVVQLPVQLMMDLPTFNTSLTPCLMQRYSSFVHNPPQLELLPPKCWCPFQRMCFLGRIIVLLPDLYRLVALSSYQPQSCPIECGAHHAGFRTQGTWLRNRVAVLKSMSRFPVIEAVCSVVAARKRDIVLVHGNCVDNAVGRLEVLHEVAAWTHPLLHRLR